MKKNPFYGISVLAMLCGCYLIDHALRLEPRQVGGLVVLIGVLQVYEVLLVGLGVILVSTGKAPRDGMTLLVLETLFLLDATFLVTECVTADPGVGTGVAMLLSGLAIAKLGLVRRFVPGTLPTSVAALLGLQAILVFALPLAVTQLASLRALAPVSLHALWWVTLGLPLAQRLVEDTLVSAHGSEVPHTVVGWTWLPALSVLAHLAALGWIYQVPFHPAFATPFVLGLALASGRDQAVRQVVLPAAAVLMSLGQSEALGFPLLGMHGPWISPLRVATIGAAVAYAILARRSGHRWLAALGVTGFAAGLLGPELARLGEALTLASRLVPRDALSWGFTGVAGAFVFLALGARKSLRGGRTPPWRPWRALSNLGDVTSTLLLAALSAGFILWAISSHPYGHPGQKRPALAALGLGVAALTLGARARARTARPGRPGRDAAERQAAGVALLAATGGLFVAVPLLATPGHDPTQYEQAVVGRIRAIIRAQATYESHNGGYADASLRCLADPAGCLPGYGRYRPPIIPGFIATLGDGSGYRLSFHPGPPPDEIPPGASRSSVRTWALVAVPLERGYTGVRGFCGDSTGRVLFTPDGSPPPLAPDVTCDREASQLLR